MRESIGSRSPPMRVSSGTTVPALAPDGLMASIRGRGSPGCCWALADAASSAATTAQRRKRNMRGLLREERVGPRRAWAVKTWAWGGNLHRNPNGHGENGQADGRPEEWIGLLARTVTPLQAQ